MDLGLKGKVALVGGGSQGIGRGIAEVLAGEGVRLAIYALDDDYLATAQRELSTLTDEPVVAVGGDVRSVEDCNRIIDSVADQLGGLDVLVTNMASSVYHGDVLEESDDGWRDEFELYTNSVIRLSRRAVPLLEQAGGGAIVNLSSCGLHQAIPDLAVSEVVRLATAGFSKYLALQVAPKGIRVTSVLPGWVSGERIEEVLVGLADELGSTRDSIYEDSVSAIPAGRYATAHEIGQAVAFLASDCARYITGTTLRVDGGWGLAPTS